MQLNLFHFKLLGCDSYTWIFRESGNLIHTFNAYIVLELMKMVLLRVEGMIMNEVILVKHPLKVKFHEHAKGEIGFDSEVMIKNIAFMLKRWGKLID